jgi:hypothetical protein
MKLPNLRLIGALCVVLGIGAVSLYGQGDSVKERKSGKFLFENETFGGNGRTCLTCHSRETGTVSPEDAQRRFVENAGDPLFVHDGSDNGAGQGVTRILANATILMEIPLPGNVRMAKDDPVDPKARSVVVRRGIPTTLNTPALDPVLMLDGRQPTLEAQALGAIRDHAQSREVIPHADLRALKQFQMTDAFFTSAALRDFARGGPAPGLPEGTTASEQRGRHFFEHADPRNAANDGLCATCHSGPLLNQANEFLPLVGVNLPEGSRFQTVGVSEFNTLGNTVRHFVFHAADGTKKHLSSPDPGRALITGVIDDAGKFDSVNAFKISVLRGISRTAPYFHDNSAKTLEDVMVHYAKFFAIVTGGAVQLTPENQADIVAFMKLL